MCFHPYSPQPLVVHDKIFVGRSDGTPGVTEYRERIPGELNGEGGPEVFRVRQCRSRVSGLRTVDLVQVNTHSEYPLQRKKRTLS